MANKLDPIRESAAAALLALDKFPTIVERFLKEAPMAETRFGRNAANMPDFVRLLRDGRAMRAPTIRKALSYISTYGF